MEQKKQIMSSGLVYDRLPPNLSPKYPWLISQTLEANNNEDQIFYTIHADDDNYPTTHNNYYRCRIPELVGRRIRGCFHGWVILSSHPDQVMWSLWNPLTYKTISLPPLILKDQSDPAVSIKQCCLSSPPPHDHDQDSSCSVLLLTRPKKSTFVFCRLDDSSKKRKKRLRWIEMTYAKQLKSITGSDNDLLHCLTFCNGKLYALSWAGGSNRLLQVDIKDRTTSRGGGEVVITLLLLGNLPRPCNNTCKLMTSFLKGSGTQLFYIILGFDKIAKKTIGAVYLFKLDFTSMTWEEILEDDDDVKDNVVFFVNLAHQYCSVDCKRTIASESGGGYIHILGDTGRVIYSCHLKDKTVSQSRLVVPTIHVSLWECRLQAGDHDEEEIKCRANNNSKQEDDCKMVVRSGVGDDEESILVNYIPFDVLETIMKFCIGVDYLKFRATCKYCRLAAPMIGWRNRRRLQSYSLVSPWLVVFDKYKGIITFTDPMFGDNYFIKTPPELIGEYRIISSGYGWLLLINTYRTLELFFFNPFTNDVRKLPLVSGVDSLCFSEPPTSPDCMLVGFSAIMPWNVYVRFVNREQYWLLVAINFGSTVPPNFFKFPTFYGVDGDIIYALNGGQLNVFREGLMELGSYYSWDGVVAEAPPIRGGGGGCSSSSQSQSSPATLYFLVKCDLQHLLLVVVDEFGESIEVFKQRQNDDHPIIREEYWEKIDSLGRHMIYICGSTCLCVEAKTPEMKNKIFFPLHKSGKIVFYSLETCMYHTFDGRKIDEAGIRDFFGTKYHIYTHAWIEPSWS